MINIDSRSANPKASCPSNLTPRSFIFDGIECASPEGVLQAFKFSNIEVQRQVCLIDGRAAKSAGSSPDALQWKRAGVLTWQGVNYPRLSRAYQNLLTHLYDAVYEQDESFRNAIAELEFEDICHTTGEADPTETVLTEAEFIHQINRLRIRYAREQFRQLGVMLQTALGKDSSPTPDVSAPVLPKAE